MGYPTDKDFKKSRQQRRPPGQHVDTNKQMWEAICQAAKESNWIPPDYMMNDWVADVCSFLRNGAKVRFDPATPADIQKRIQELRTEEHRLAQKILGDPMVGVSSPEPCWATIPGNGFDNVGFCILPKGHKGPHQL